MEEYDFSGWATRNNIQCSDGRTIMKNAFKDNDGQKVPLVWNHQHDDPNEVLGHALLENRDEGVYAYCKFNDTESGRTAKALVVNGDVDKLSIYANKLKSQMNNVIHGCIREVSLVLAGANPGAFIDSVITHSDENGDEEEGVIYTDEEIVINNEEPEANEASKSDDNDGNKSEDNDAKEDSSEDHVEHSDKGETVGEILDDLTDAQKEMVNELLEAIDQGKEVSNKEEIKKFVESLDEKHQNAIFAAIGTLVEDKEKNKEGEDKVMKHNVFEQDNDNQDVLAHSDVLKIESDTIADAKRYGSMRESFIAHAEESGFEFGEKTDYSVLFPDATNINREPKMVDEKDDSWVSKVMNGVKHSPFSRVKNTLGKLDEATARAKGYIKGSKKVDYKLAFLNRVTTPTTVYVKKDIDRDDVIDITDFDIVAWQKSQMRKLLDKDLALAMLLGDGRNISDPHKINEQNIRPIYKDNDMYTIKYVVKEGVDYKIAGNSYSENDSATKGIIRGAIKARKEYRGSGRPTFYTTEDILTDLLLIEDQNGRLIYDSVEKLATALRVKEIVTVPEMEKYTNLYGIIVNLADYTAGADKGGNVNLFDDFDIDYNQMKYLIETRMSGALTEPKSAIALLKTEPTTNTEEEQPPVEG